MRTGLAAIALLLCYTHSTSGQPQTQPLPEPTLLTPLSSTAQCNQCTGTLLAGRTYPHPETKWGIISDLPESFCSYGVLYSTCDVLPDNGAGVEELRHQRKAIGFTTIDGGFDVFFWHLTRMTSGTRIIVYVKNRGSEVVTLDPRQVIKSEGVIGTQHEFESTLASRVLARTWDIVATATEAITYPEITFGGHPPPGSQWPTVSIPPGEGRVIAYGKQFGNVEKGPDASNNVNCFGYVRATLPDNKPQPDLEVSVVAIPVGPREAMQAETEKLLDIGARSTDKVPMDRGPQGCALARAVGVYPNFIWKNDPLVIDASKLDEAGTSFPMCLPKVQTTGCADARQTTDLALRPGYTREDTIGNYMIEYQITATLTNSSAQPVTPELVFGKTGADVGLAFSLEVAAHDGPAVLNQGVTAASWAGPKQSARERPISVARPMLIQPGNKTDVKLRFLVCGNSSLPFFLGFKRSK